MCRVLEAGLIATGAFLFLQTCIMHPYKHTDNKFRVILAFTLLSGEPPMSLSILNT